MTHPPRWTRALVESALPSDPMRDAILGDLHEEFMHDVRDLDVRRASMRHVRRAAGIVTRALLDAAICRNWVSTTPVAGREPGTERVQKPDEVAAVRSGPRGARGLAGDAAFAVLALIVVVVGVVANTMLFSAAASGSARASAAASTGGVAVLVASVFVAATVLCVGPRWRRKRLGGAMNPLNS